MNKEQAEKRAQRLLGDAIDAVESFANRYDHENKADRISLIKMLIGIAMNALVQELGLFEVIIFLPRALKVACTKIVKWEI